MKCWASFIINFSVKYSYAHGLSSCTLGHCGASYQSRCSILWIMFQPLPLQFQLQFCSFQSYYENCPIQVCLILHSACAIDFTFQWKYHRKNSKLWVILSFLSTVTLHISSCIETMQVEQDCCGSLLLKIKLLRKKYIQAFFIYRRFLF